MTVNFQYVNTDISETLCVFAKEKLNKLFSKYGFLISANVRIKHDDNFHDKGKICDIELSLPGPRLFATSNEANYEMAVKETIKDLEHQLKKRKKVYKTY